MEKEEKLGMRDAEAGREVGSGVRVPYLQQPSKNTLSSATLETRQDRKMPSAFFHSPQHQEAQTSKTTLLIFN